MKCVLILCIALVYVESHDSCCKKKANQAFIANPNESPPDVDANGQPRRIDDPDDVKPSSWDDDDDGTHPPRNSQRVHARTTCRCARGRTRPRVRVRPGVRVQTRVLEGEHDRECRALEAVDDRKSSLQMGTNDDRQPCIPAAVVLRGTAG